MCGKTVGTAQVRLCPPYVRSQQKSRLTIAGRDSLASAIEAAAYFR
jgi:hypothetical protein